MIAVTGGAGFIGSAIVWQLNQRGIDDIIVVDLAGTETREHLHGIRFRDFMTKEAFADAFDAGALGGIEAVIHMGADSSTTTTDWGWLAENNLGYTRRLCERSLAEGVRFIYASSAATYGDGSRGYRDNHDLIPELQPLNLYGRSKQEFDRWAFDEGVLDRIVGLKYFNVYGPNEYHKGDMRSMVLKGYEQVRDTGGLKLFRSDRPEYVDGGQDRDFVYVKDAVNMTLFFLDHPEANGIFNVGTGEAATWNRLGAAIFSALNMPANITYVDMPENLKGKYQYHTQAEMGKLRAAGYTAPMTPIEAAVADYVRNYLMDGSFLTAG